jgi:hypothetical protein
VKRRASVEQNTTRRQNRQVQPNCRKRKAGVQKDIMQIGVVLSIGNNTDSRHQKFV